MKNLISSWFTLKLIEWAYYYTDNGEVADVLMNARRMQRNIYEYYKWEREGDN